MLYEGYLPRAFPAFEAEHGRIVHSMWCVGTANATALTSKPEEKGRGTRTEYHRAGSMGQIPDVDRLLVRCDTIAKKADQLLRGRDLDDGLSGVYAEAGHLLGLLDSHVRKAQLTLSKNDSDTIKAIKGELDRLECSVNKAADRTNEWDYFVGMIGSAAVLLLGAALVTMVFQLPMATPAVAGFTAGAVGAVVSVLQRMSRETFTLAREATRRLVTVLGGFRPVLGAVMGTIMYTLSAGALIPLTIPAEPAAQVAFFGGLGFISGFSERFAPDMLGKVEGRLATPAVGAGEEEREGENETGTQDER